MPPIFAPFSSPPLSPNVTRPWTPPVTSLDPDPWSYFAKVAYVMWEDVKPHKLRISCSDIKI